MKKTIFILIQTSVLAQQVGFIDYDWGGQLGYLTQDGILVWNKDWESNNILFDGTWTNYPRMYGSKIEEGYYSENEIPEFNDSLKIRSNFMYDQGDYLLDRFSFNIDYNGNNRILSFHGFKRSYAGTYNQYSTNTNQPIQQSYVSSYNSLNKGTLQNITIAHFNTFSGIADSLSNGLLDKRITSFNFTREKKVGAFYYTIKMNQFLQRFKSIHSSAYYQSVRYLTRTRLLMKLDHMTKNKVNFSSILESNQRNIKLGALYSIFWHRLMISVDWNNYDFKLSFIGNDQQIEPEIFLGFNKSFKNLYFNLFYQNIVLPNHIYLRLINDEYNFIQKSIIFSQIELIGDKNRIAFFTNLLNYQEDEGLNNLNLYSKSDTYEREKNHLSIGLNISSTILPKIKLDFYYGHQLIKNYFSDGISDKIRISTDTDVKLFNGFMDLKIGITLNGFLNRDQTYYLHPIELVPQESVFDSNGTNNLNDIWFINTYATAQVSTFTIRYEWFNLNEIILGTLGSENDNFFNIHPSMPNLGRQMILSVHWKFLD